MELDRTRLRMKENGRCLMALTWTPEGRWKVGHPKTTWQKIVEKNLNWEGIVERSQTGG